MSYNNRLLRRFTYIIPSSVGPNGALIPFNNPISFPSPFQPELAHLDVSDSTPFRKSVDSPFSP